MHDLGRVGRAARNVDGIVLHAVRVQVSAPARTLRQVGEGTSGLRHVMDRDFGRPAVPGSALRRCDDHAVRYVVERGPDPNLVLLLTSHMLASLLEGGSLHLKYADPLQAGMLTGTLNIHSLDSCGVSTRVFATSAVSNSGDATIRLEAARGKGCGRTLVLIYPDGTSEAVSVHEPAQAAQRVHQHG